MRGPNHPPRLFVFGWDAADWAIIEAGWRQGRLPVIRSIVDRGQRGTLMSTVPNITPVAWTSFLTGADPGEHGIFGFKNLRKGEYQAVQEPGGARAVPTLFRTLDSKGYRTAQVTIPWTYPAEPLEHGVVVPGWDDPTDGFDTTHPQDMGRSLAGVVPRVPRRHQFFDEAATHASEETAGIDLRERIAGHILEREVPDVFMMVYSEPDHASHRLWREGEVPGALIDVYEEVDRSTGRLMERFVRDEDVVVVVSDHGSKPMHTAVGLAPLLMGGGFVRPTGTQQVLNRVPLPVRMVARKLKALKNLRKRLNKNLTQRLDPASTKIFPVGDHLYCAGMVVNARPTYPNGPVGPDEYETLRGTVIEHLSKVKHPKTGRSPFLKVARREDVYEGRAVDRAPDIVVVVEDGYTLHPGLHVTSPFVGIKMGGHRYEGMYATSRPLPLTEVEQISEIFPKLLAGLGYPSERLEIQTEAGAVGYTAEESDEIEARLRDLGYLE